MKLQGKNKFDTWLLNSDWTKSHKYFFFLFLFMACWEGYSCYDNYHSQAYYSAVIDAFTTGVLLVSVIYYSIILRLLRDNSRLSKVNVELVIENHQCKREILLNKNPNNKN